MKSEHSQIPTKLSFDTDEMVIGNLQSHSIAGPEAWLTAMKVQERVITGFRIIRGMQTDELGQPSMVNPRREDMAYKTVALASRLITFAVAYEIEVLMLDIDRERNNDATDKLE